MILPTGRIRAYTPGTKREGSLKLSSNENPLGTSPLAFRAMQASLEQAALYPPVLPSELHAAIARWRGVAESQVIVGNGSDEIFTLAAACLIEPGLSGIGSAHSFSQYRYAVELFRGVFVDVPTRADLSVNVEGLVEAVNARTRILFLCSPNNPTGLVLSEAELRFVLEKLPEHVLVVVDQAYGDYANANAFTDARNLLPEYDNLLVTGTFSKIFGLAALRIGYALGHESIIQALQSVKPPFNTNLLAQKASLAALGDQTFYAESRDSNHRSRARFHEGLSALGIEYLHGHGNFICVKNPVGQNIAERLQAHNITVRRLDSFGLPQHVRITIPPLEVTERILGILGN